MSRYFTKSVFKEAMECPLRLNYCNRKEYANQNLMDDFLIALADGGFQVGELAKIYYSVPIENDLTGTNEEIAARTSELLKQENVTIAEAGFIWENCFCRVDILKKTGNRIDIIEAKAKSWNSENSFLTKRKSGDIPKGAISSIIRKYVYDVAFQKYVVSNALNGFSIHAYLMMADKQKTANVDGLNQYFKIKKVNGRTSVERQPEAEKLNEAQHILTPFDVDEICNAIIDGTTPGQKAYLHNYSFAEFVKEMSRRYCNQEQINASIASLSTSCYSCPYYTLDANDKLKDGYDQCWCEATKGMHYPYTSYSEKPLLEELWNDKKTFFEDKKWFLEQLTSADFPIGINDKDVTGLCNSERRWIQVAFATNRVDKIESKCNIHDGMYLDIPNLKAEMENWEFPLHMIDFETSTVALPYYRDMNPYESVAFQFSHHIIESDNGGKTYTIRHAGQWINESAEFPNFEFVRKLKASLGEVGTIFRFSNHENSILREIRNQLLARNDQPDIDELVNFIDSITHTTRGEVDMGIPPNRGLRDMVDLCDIVKRFYYDPYMKGSNSIKVVLPAVLNRSVLLKKKYSQPIYGKEIPSLNISQDSPKSWIVEENGQVINPYKHLEDISAFFPEGTSEAVHRINEQELEELTEKQVNNGGGALWAYGLLQFCSQTPTQKKALVEALYRYCELDTLAMVFIWEFFNEMVNKPQS